MLSLEGYKAISSILSFITMLCAFLLLIYLAYYCYTQENENIQFKVIFYTMFLTISLFFGYMCFQMLFNNQLLI